VALTVAATLVAGLLTAMPNAVPTAQADEPRPPRSTQLGLVPPNVATEVMPTDITIAPGPNETFAPFRIVAVQLVPMIKTLFNGGVDPDHAIAEWYFTLRFVRSPDPWPPFLPEPTDPWTFSLFEMPDGGITGISLAHQGSPLYAPPSDLPANWLYRLVPAARAQIPQPQLLGSWVPRLLAALPIPAGALRATAEATVLGMAQGVLAQAQAGQAPNLDSFVNDPNRFFGDEAEVLNALGSIASALAGLVASLLTTAFPCFTKIFPIGMYGLAVFASLYAAALTNSPFARLLLTAAAVVYEGFALPELYTQVLGCYSFVVEADALCPEFGCGGLATWLAVAWVGHSAFFMLAPWYSGLSGQSPKIAELFRWYGQQPSILFDLFLG
jgi:hypothetical protein